MTLAWVGMNHEAVGGVLSLTKPDLNRPDVNADLASAPSNPTSRESHVMNPSAANVGIMCRSYYTRFLLEEPVEEPIFMHARGPHETFQVFSTNATLVETKRLF